MKRFIPPVIFFIVICIALEILVRQGWIAQTLIPAPSQIIASFKELHSDFITALKETTLNTIAGLILSIVLGSLISFAFSLNDLLKKSILPFAIFFQTVPIIAIAPLLVIYFGFGSPTVIASSFMVSVFPIIANTLTGLENISPLQKDLFKVYHANKWQILFKLRLPNAYASIYSGIKIAIGLSLIGAVAGEFVAGGGLGAMIDSARTQQRVDIVFASLLLLSLLGLVLIGILNLINRFLLTKRPYVTGDL
ncbi:ABC transporter permease [Bdellovibrio sp. NC01]|uniref:ABC transporter permease n=1 Tax=Bdellovibrio sp. NC01 TaxID=2220073 RepID=UPI0011570385|nr:ABC transporter permease [Bdellovibrio sp. NC01]QDK37816.1 ABC transporter permease [Bdellovibrio sp. NC01]